MLEIEDGRLMDEPSRCRIPQARGELSPVAQLAFRGWSARLWARGVLQPVRVTDEPEEVDGRLPRLREELVRKAHGDLPPF